MITDIERGDDPSVSFGTVSHYISESLCFHKATYTWGNPIKSALIQKMNILHPPIQFHSEIHHIAWSKEVLMAASLSL